jgi:hypothetical protein
VLLTYVERGRQEHARTHARVESHALLLLPIDCDVLWREAIWCLFGFECSAFHILPQL